MIRPIHNRDIPKLREMGFTWEFGTDYLCGLVLVDAKDEPLQCMAAWSKPEVHMGSANYSTPGARWADMRTLHDAMEVELKGRGIKEVVTFFDVCERFCKRLFTLNWVQSSRISLHRKVG